VLPLTRPVGAALHGKIAHNMCWLPRPTAPSCALRLATASPQLYCLLACLKRRQLAKGGYRGEPIHELYCDEVQVGAGGLVLLGWCVERVVGAICRHAQPVQLRARQALWRTAADSHLRTFLLTACAAAPSLPAMP